MRVEPEGPVPCDLMLVGESPGHEEQMLRSPFVGRAGQELWAAVDRHCGLYRQDWYITNVVKAGLPHNRAPKPAEVAEGLSELLDEIAEVKPRIVVTAGAVASRVFLDDRPMADVHGIPHAVELAGHRMVVVPIYHPAAGLHNKGYLSAFHFDLDRVGAAVRGDCPVWAQAPSGRSSWLLQAPTSQFQALGGPWVAVDTEGWADRPWGLSFSFDGKYAYVIKSGQTAVLEWFSRWIRDRVVVGHNLMHDLPVLRAMGIDCPIHHDTQVLGYHDMMRTGSGVLEAESQNLGTLAYRECGLRLGELKDLPGVDFATQTIPYSDSVLAYAGDDAIATYRLFEMYRRRGLTDTIPYQIDMGQIPLVEEMIATGLPVDLDAASQYYIEVLTKLDDVTADLQKRAARMGKREFNPGSHPQVRELITKKIGLRIRKRTKGGKASTNEKALAEHQNHPFVEQLQIYRELKKLSGTYLEPLMETLS